MRLIARRGEYNKIWARRVDKRKSEKKFVAVMVVSFAKRRLMGCERSLARDRSARPPPPQVSIRSQCAEGGFMRFYKVSGVFRSGTVVFRLSYLSRLCIRRLTVFAACFVLNSSTILAAGPPS